MPNKRSITKQSRFIRWIAGSLSFPWFEVAGELMKIGLKLMRGMASEGVYEVLDYESTLEIHDKRGRRATFYKRKKIRYLQDNIIAYQDYAWGDGEILQNYRTNRGKAVDRYRSGYKTYILLSLREIKNRGDIDEFNIKWGLRNGFLTKDGYWDTDVSNKTKRIRVRVIFPKTRPPHRLVIEESNRQRTRMLGMEAVKRLPDGRWQVTWEAQRPRLFEHYIIRWEW